MQQTTATPLDGIRYFTPPDGYVLTGRDGRVSLLWRSNVPVPLLTDDYPRAVAAGSPDYDMVGNGIYQALRLNPDCQYAADFADVLREAYPHIISEIGGQAIMLEAKDVDSPYLDRKITCLRIMALLDRNKPELQREIARSYKEKGSRLDALQSVVASWYGAEKSFKLLHDALPDDALALYEYGEVLYVLGRYQQAAGLWSDALPQLKDDERRAVSGWIADILAGRLPLVPPIDYLSAVAVALEEREYGRHDEAAAILEDVLADAVFGEHFPLQELHYLLGSCYQELGLMEQAAAAFKRS